mmetsp:Transcript_23506/g.54551  ORF Transcript_23506/g.54551 Transcript_23506/m.54551 type:complete len:266 (-) Transcript_23506:765-1562(-)
MHSLVHTHAHVLAHILVAPSTWKLLLLRGLHAAPLATLPGWIGLGSILHVVHGAWPGGRAPVCWLLGIRCGCSPIAGRVVHAIRTGHVLLSRRLCVWTSRRSLIPLRKAVCASLPTIGFLKRRVHDELTALVPVNGELCGVVRKEELEALIHLLQVGAGAWRQRDSEHAEQHPPVSRLAHLGPALCCNEVTGHSSGVGHRHASLLGGFLQSPGLALARAIGIKENLYISVFHSTEVQLVTGSRGCLLRFENHAREAGRAAVAIHH